MPLFRRHDGDPVQGLPAVRRIMPILMRRRNESIVLHDVVYQVGAARRWLREYNRSHPGHATLFDLFAYACVVIGLILLAAKPRSSALKKRSKKT